ncbi:MAG TPA: ECF-type sigma factor [Woeseiaceae bacterium]|nr:ECF-type sigma factor [Woeseiaceae bacterium]
MANDIDITGLLRAWSGGDEQALDSLTPLIYDELHRLALRVFAGERPGHTLQPTALVNEAYMQLMKADVPWQDRAHFYALSGRLMRRLLVNHANSRNAGKRGGKVVNVTLNEALHAGPDAETDLLKLDDALTQLAAVDERKAQLVELQYFGGLSFREMENVTGLSSSTIDRHLRIARAWLKAELSED